MGKAEDRSKSTEKRKQEKERTDAEIERSLSVAKMKEAHKKIEETEKERKKPQLQSLLKRISNLKREMLSTIEYLQKMSDMKILKGGGVEAFLVNYESKYDSIRFDLQKTFDIREEDLAKLFPRVEIRITRLKMALSNLLFIMSQLRDIEIYCERLKKKGSSTRLFDIFKQL